MIGRHRNTSSKSAKPLRLPITTRCRDTRGERSAGHKIPEMEIAASSMTRRALLASSLFALALIAGRGIAETRLSSLASLRFLRGGRAAFAPAATKPLGREPHSPERNPLARLLSETERHWNGIAENAVREWGRLGQNVGREWDNLGRNVVREWDKLGDNVGREWDKLGDNIGREWGRLARSVGNLFQQSGQRTRDEGTKKLDDVLRSFKSVLSSSGELDTAQLLRACRAHLTLMKSGGSALKLVAKDMEANLEKAEALFGELPDGEGRHLASFLEIERGRGIHDGNQLRDPSAAMGLLWIRRSLDFQKDLYASLIPSKGRHPQDTAMEAYDRTLSPYHGWLLQKVFPLSFSSMPDRSVLIAKFGGRDADEVDDEYERDIAGKLRTLVDTWDPIIGAWRREFERLDLEDTRRA